MTAVFLVTGGDAAGIGGLNVANVLAFIIVARWIHPFGFVASLAFWSGVRLSDDHYRSVVVWAKSIVIGESCRSPHKSNLIQLP